MIASVVRARAHHARLDHVDGRAHADGQEAGAQAGHHVRRQAVAEEARGYQRRLYLRPTARRMCQTPQHETRRTTLPSGTDCAKLQSNEVHLQQKVLQTMLPVMQAHSWHGTEIAPCHSSPAPPR